MNVTPLSLFDEPVSDYFESPIARLSDPSTSHDAAQDALPHASRGRVLVMQWLSRGPLTDFELAACTGWQQTSIGKRRGECVKAGLVRATSEKRPAPSGSLSIVWEITDLGVEWTQRFGREAA